MAGARPLRAPPARSHLGLELGDPYRPLKSAGVFGRLRERLADPATWKDLVYLFLAFPLGLLSFIVTITLSALVLGFLLAPVWYWTQPQGIELGLLTIDSLPKALVVVPLGAVSAVLGLLAVRALAAMHTAAARILLGSSPDPELSARVEDLQGSRARIIAAADAERRRLERDLHDGAQQRLVAVSLVLGLARRRIAGGQDAGDLLAQADEEAASRSPSCGTSRGEFIPPFSRTAAWPPASRTLPRARACQWKSRAFPRSGCPSPSRRRPTSWSPRR